MADAGKVAIAYVHDNELATSFHDSLMQLIMFDLAHDGLLAHADGRMSIRYGTDGLVAARNTVAKSLLASGVEWLLWIDSDMGFEPDALYRLLAVADPTERPIVGGLCFANREFGHDGMGGFWTAPRPTIYDWRNGPDGLNHFIARDTYPINSVLRCAGTGSALILVHRSVFERISAHAVETGQPAEGWYDRARGTDGSLLGEDISFCARAAAAGIPIHVHTGVRTSHLKEVWLGESDHWRRFTAPAATGETAVLVPVMRRPRNAAPFMTSLRASTGLAKCYAVAHDDDRETIAAWLSAGAEVLSGDVTTFAEKVNFGYRHTSEPWMLLVGDDVRFRSAWLDHAQHVAESFGADVVGTNDLANPAVIAGDHAVHPLIRRAYVDRMGASWDGPGVVAHEGYRHWFVDNEIVTAAKQRGVWQMALGSIVEHLHPYVGKADHDEVYALGESSAERDREVFEQRCATYL
ncbi:MAG TPA: hypothetical protein VHA75_15835 [Rugosimonospora sp.]|nr:hypothetical protein [Rugosimonospora sp.]